MRSMNGLTADTFLCCNPLWFTLHRHRRPYGPEGDRCDARLRRFDLDPSSRWHWGVHPHLQRWGWQHGGTFLLKVTYFLTQTEKQHTRRYLNVKIISNTLKVNYKVAVCGGMLSNTFFTFPAKTVTRFLMLVINSQIKAKDIPAFNNAFAYTWWLPRVSCVQWRTRLHVLRN